MEKEELEKRIEETRSSLLSVSYDGGEIIRKYEERLERLEQLYVDLYGW